MGHPSSSLRRSTFVATLAFCSVAARGAEGEAPTLEALREASPAGSFVAATTLFAFHSDFLTNLDDALRWSSEREERAEQLLGACAAELPPEARAGWASALATYRAEAESLRGLEGIHVRMQLARLEDELDGDVIPLSPGRRRALAEASYAYRSCAWPASDARNRTWISERVAGIKQLERALAERLVELYQTAWPALPMRVDAMYYVSWAGGDSATPAHIRISSANPGNEGWSGVEIAFHEGSHMLMHGWGGSVAWDTLTAAGTRLGVDVPFPVYHAVLFYVTGRAVEAELGRRDVAYVPYMLANGLFSDRSGPIAAAFDPYLAGRATLEQACTTLVESLRSTASTSPR
jgi:hypothetical protein